MNLIEAHKLAHEGWVRSPTRTNGTWVTFDHWGARARGDLGADLDAEDWEPKPKAEKPFEMELWVHSTGIWLVHINPRDEEGWRKIRVREVME